jgi:hypothetical protein
MATQMVQMDLDMLLSSTPESPNDADWLAVINQALRFISRRVLLFNPAVSLTLTAGGKFYNLRDISTPTVGQRVLQPVSVSINGAVLRDRFSRNPGLWSFEELQAQYPSYLTAGEGTPSLAVWLGNNDAYNLILYPAPSSVVVTAGQNWISGLVLPADLALDTDVPGIPEECHEAVAALAAVYASLPGVTEQEAWQRVQAYGRYHEPVEQVRAANLQALRFGGVNSDTSAPTES